MIRVGKIMIDPDSIDTILQENIAKTNKGNVPDKIRGITYIQIIYKSGVVKNFTSEEIGLSYFDFLEALEREIKKSNDKKMFKLIAALKPNNNG